MIAGLSLEYAKKRAQDQAVRRQLHYAVMYDPAAVLDWRLGWGIEPLYNVSLDDARLRYIASPDGTLSKIGV
jgi:hypothetical protein